MQTHTVRVHPERDRLPRERQLAWRMARVATDPVPVEPAVAEMIVNRLVDNVAVAVAALDRRPVAVARAQALARPATNGGANVLGLGIARRFAPEWAAWANATAVRELDFHDTFLAADYSHPGDTIAPILAVAQHLGLDGAATVRGIATAYEIQIALVKGICLHAHKIDHVAHLAPAIAAGLGAALGLGTEGVHQAIQQALHVNTATRQSRKGEISSWKAFAPAHAAKTAIEAVDRAMRGEGAPSPIYEGEDAVIAWLLDGPSAEYVVTLPEPGEPKRLILESYTKAHSAEYQAQALIDLASRLGAEVEARTRGDWDRVREVVVHTSHHTHHVIGSGANDPQKTDPGASRETLDHSILYILAVALQDRRWHHVDSYLPERARRADTVRLWHRIRTVEDAQWTRRYHAVDAREKAFGGRVVVTLDDGSVIEGEQALADAHAFGRRPFARADYVAKFETLAGPMIEPTERARFLDVATSLPTLPAGRLGEIGIEAPPDRVAVEHLPAGLL